MFGASPKPTLPKGEAPKGTLRSEVYDDVYFDEHDGLSETRYVFLDGNILPEAWKTMEPDQHTFTICETGFGTGLNFLATWKLFEETAPPDKKLHFISFEKFPLDGEEIEAILVPWAKEFGDYFQCLKAHYPLLVPGFHRMHLSDRVSVTLIFDDVNHAFPKLHASVDAWFLDGFKPSTNPEMWSQTVFDNMARLSHDHTTFSTFTAAGAVKRGLQSAGFSVRKVPGFGTKRDMLVGEKLEKQGW
jgi:tRNA 5-methylaminomethyl-2-thiouridine biosynthesis bifunctional protein